MDNYCGTIMQHPKLCVRVYVLRNQEVFDYFRMRITNVIVTHRIVGTMSQIGIIHGDPIRSLSEIHSFTMIHLFL